MREFSFSPEIIAIFLVILFLLFALQTLVLIRIRKLLQNISSYTENISKFFYKYGVFTVFKPKTDLAPKTCQYCKFRLSFIHMGNNESGVEDFYYKCKLQNTDIRLQDTCEHFESEKTI